MPQVTSTAGTLLPRFEGCKEVPIHKVPHAQFVHTGNKGKGRRVCEGEEKDITNHMKCHKSLKDLSANYFQHKIQKIIVK